MPAPLRLIAPTAALLAFGASKLSLGVVAPAHALETSAGSWRFTSAEGDLPARCIAINATDEKGARLIAYVAPLGVIKFAYGDANGQWRKGEQVQLEALVDGRSIDLGAVEAINATSVLVASAVAGRDRGSLLSAMENGEKAVVQTGGVRSTFDLTETKRAVALLSRCDMNMVEFPATVSAPSPVASSDAAPVWAERQGSWEIAAVANPFDTRCLAVNKMRPGVFLSAHQKQGRITFGVRSAELTLDRWTPPRITLTVDGRPVALRSPSVFDGHTVLFEDAGGSQNGGTLMSALRRGWRTEIKLDDQSYEFQLGGTIAALSALTECETKVATAISSSASNTTLSAEEEAELDLEREGDLAEARAASAAEDRSGSPSPATPNDNTADALGRAMKSMTGSARPIAQFRCLVTGTDLMGLPDLSGRAKKTALQISVAGDGTALVNGQTLQPLRTEGSGTAMTSAVYSARELIDATMGTQGDRAPVAGLTDHQMDAYRAFMGAGRMMVDQAMGGKPRYMIVALELDTVAFFDLDANNQPANQTTPSCRRTM